MAEAAFPARLHVLMARDSLRSLVIRKGPSRHVGFFEWNRGTDRISVGQWLFGRVYERRCDISPDGKHVIYFASKQQRQATGGPTAWTAISKTPYLKALAFYPQDSTWLGGGLFINNQTYAPRAGGAPEFDRSGLKVGEVPFTHPQGNAECLGVYYPRLERDGWAHEAHQPRPHGTHGCLGRTTVFSKPVGRGWTLIKECHADINHPEGAGVYWDEHLLVDPAGEIVELENIGWADADRGDLVFAKEGRLCRLKQRDLEDIGAAKIIHDFNAEDFRQLTAPY